MSMMETVLMYVHPQLIQQYLPTHVIHAQTTAKHACLQLIAWAVNKINFITKPITDATMFVVETHILILVSVNNVHQHVQVVEWLMAKLYAFSALMELSLWTLKIASNSVQMEHT